MHEMDNARVRTDSARTRNLSGQAGEHMRAAAAEVERERFDLAALGRERYPLDLIEAERWV